MTLPAEGRDGAPPEWPLDNWTDREAVLWGKEWKRPQAIMWERNGQELEVAMYVRAFAAAEMLNATVASRTLVRQLQEALGISIPGLLRNHWRIEAGAEDAATSGTEPKRHPVASARDRFKVRDGDAASG